MKDLTINDLVIVPPRYRIMMRKLSRNTSLSTWPRIHFENGIEFTLPDVYLPWIRWNEFAPATVTETEPYERNALVFLRHLTELEILQVPLTTSLPFA